MFPGIFSDVVRFTATPAGKPFQNMSSKNAGAGKLCTIFHQIKDRVFSFTADDGQAAQINHQFSSIQIPAHIFASGTKLSDPETAQLAFYDEPALGGRFDDGNLEHNGNPNDDSARAIFLPKFLKP